LALPLWELAHRQRQQWPIPCELDGQQYLVAAAGGRFVAFGLNE
jgi:hypothetical protein